MSAQHDQDNVVAVFAAAVRRYGDAPALSHLGLNVSFRRLDRLSTAFAEELQTRTELAPGDRLAVQLPNLVQYLVAVLAAFKAGLVVVNANPLDSAEGLLYRLRDSGARALVTLAGNPAAAEALASLPLDYVWQTTPGDLHPLPQRLVIDGLWRWQQRRQWRPLPAARQLRQALSWPVRPSATGGSVATDLAVLQYTGGTTGRPKGVMLSHSNLVANIRQFHDAMADFGFTAGSCQLLPLPLYHIYAFTVSLFALSEGLHNVLVVDPRRIDRLLGDFRRYPVTIFFGLTTLFNAICAHPVARRVDWSRLQVSFAGGMALTEGARQSWKQCTGGDIHQAYGLSEASPLVSCNPRDDNRSDTVGKAVSECEVRVVDSSGQVLPAGEPGELQLRGPQVMSGYWGQPEDTAAVLDADGWLSTGDVVVLDQDGYIHITDRLKELVIVSGINVFPGEVEDCLSRHPAVHESAVVGLPDPDRGEELVAAVVIRGDCDLEELREFCRRHLAAYKVPRRIVPVAELPKSGVGKILRRVVREQLQGQSAQA